MCAIRSIVVGLLLLFCTVAGRKQLHESAAAGSPDKCAGPFDASNMALYRTDGIGAGRGCDTFRGKQLPMDEALGLIVRLISPPTSDASHFNLQKEIIMATLAPSKTCRLENRSGHGGTEIASPIRAGSSTVGGNRRGRDLLQEEEEEAPGPASEVSETADDLSGEEEASADEEAKPAKKKKKGPQFGGFLRAGSGVTCTPLGCKSGGRRRRHLLQEEEAAPGPASEVLETADDLSGEAEATFDEESVVEDPKPIKTSVEVPQSEYLAEAGSAVVCTPLGCKSGGRRRRHLLQEEEAAPGPASEDSETADDVNVEEEPAADDKSGEDKTSNKSSKSALSGIIQPTIAGSNVACTPFGCSSSGRRRRHLFQEEKVDLGGAPGPDNHASVNGIDEGGEGGEGEAAVSVCNGTCCVLLVVKQKDVDIVFGTSAV